MSYPGMALVFGAIAFVVANVALTMVTAAAWRLLRGRALRPGALFSLRLLPAVGALAAALGLALPSYLSFEPHRSGERASAALLAIVAAAACLIGRGFLRVAVSWFATRRIERSWRRVAEAETVGAVPLYRVPTALPFAAIVGVLRPRLYVSATLLEVLTDEQRVALLAHELGHRRAWDNLKRGLLRLAPDVLSLTRAGRAIEAAWSEAAEEAADDDATGGTEAGRLAVAGALIEASRLVPVRLATVSNFCDGGTIAHRVERLMDAQPRTGPRWAAKLLSVSALTAMVALAAGSLPMVYAATEAIVRRLQ